MVMFVKDRRGSGSEVKKRRIRDRVVVVEVYVNRGIGERVEFDVVPDMLNGRRRREMGPAITWR